MSNTEDILSRIITNTSDGATALAQLALDALEAAAAALSSDDRAARRSVVALVSRIQTLRPAMGAIGVQALLAFSRAAALHDNDGISWPGALRRAVQIERGRLNIADDSIASRAVLEIGRYKRVVTCSFSRTVQKTLVATQPVQVVIGEGHPLGDGVRAAERIAADGLRVKVVPDGSLPQLVANADAVVVGADQVLIDGSIVNRASSFSLALAAKHFDTPFHVVCQRIKISGMHRSRVSMEACPDAFQELSGSIDSYAPLFDVTPGALIHSVITETGVLTPQAVATLGGEANRMRDALTIDDPGA